MSAHKKINGYEWFDFDRGIHSFQKKTEKGWLLIECSEEQLHDGDIEFMTLHGWTLSKERKRKIIKKFELNNKQNENNR